MNTKPQAKPVVKQNKTLPLHKVIATGGSAKNYQGAKKGFK